MEEALKRIIKEAVREVLSEIELKQPDEVLSVKQLCEWLGVSPSWVSENKGKLKIPYFKMGGDKFYRKDIEKWIEENKNNIRQSRNEVVLRDSSKYKNFHQGRLKLTL